MTNIHVRVGFSDPDYFPPSWSDTCFLPIKIHRESNPALRDKRIAGFLLTKTAFLRLSALQDNLYSSKKILINERKSWTIDIFSQLNRQNLEKLRFYKFKRQDSIYKSLKAPILIAYAGERLLFKILKYAGKVEPPIIFMLFWLDRQDVEIRDKLNTRNRNINCIKNSTRDRHKKILIENAHIHFFIFLLRHSTGCRSPPPVLHFPD